MRAAFWLGFRLASRGEIGPANGWFARGHRVLEGVAGECAERGYLLLASVEEQLAAGDFEGAFEAATDRDFDRTALPGRRSDRLRAAPAGTRADP